MHHGTRFLVTTATALFVAIGTPAARADQSALQQDVNAIRDAGTTGVIAQVVDNGRSTTARAGVAELGTTRPVPLNARFRTGSTTKTFTAVVVLQLVGEGRLRLDHTVERWLPGLIRGNGNDGRRITIRQLLNHTSGIFDYTSDEGFFNTLATPEAFEANRFRRWTPRQLIDIAMSHPPDFAPGASWSYSNTGYIVLGEIIRSATGRSWRTEVRRRILAPLGLRDTTAPEDDPTLSDPHARAYHIFSTDPAGRVYTDTTVHNVSWGGAAGELITTPADENRFLSALMSGRLLEPALLAEMKSTVEIEPRFEYGLGLLWTQLSCNSEGYWSHDGGTVGYSTSNGVTGDGRLSVVVSLSTTTFTDEQFVEESWAGRDALLEHVFCGPGAQSLSPRRPPRLRSILRAR